MEALILSMGTGGGHNAAAQAVKEELERRGHTAVLMNPYTLKSGKMAKFVDSAYIATVRYVPRLFGLVYKIGDAVSKLPVRRSIIYMINRKPAKALGKYLKENHYDAIITTHLFSGEILTYLRDEKFDLPKTIFIATDYTCVPFEGEVETDACIVPSNDYIEEFARCGIALSRCYGCGIPTKSAFGTKASKEDLKKELGLDPACKYILICGGSMGAGKLRKVVRIIEERCHNEGHTKLIVVCGSNSKLFEKLYAEHGDEIILYRFTDKMPELFKLCEMCFTKPGGLTTTEAAVSGTPLVHMPPIPGCETRNVNYYVSNKMSVKVSTSKKSINRAMDYLSDRQNCLDMIKKQHELINPNAATDICNLAEKLVAEVTAEVEN